MIGWNDVFADVVNVNLFHGEQKIKPDELESVPVEMNYSDLEGKHHLLVQDIIKRVERMGVCIAFLGCENQKQISNIMPIRDMGYTYALYAKQVREIMAENKERNQEAYAKGIHDNQKLVPVITFILYFGNKKWERPLSLLDILDIPEEDRELWEQQIGNHRIHVISVAEQAEDIRKLYRSDFKVIADYLAARQNGDELYRTIVQVPKSIIHKDDLLDMLKALSGDKRTAEVINMLKQEREEAMEMEEDMEENDADSRYFWAYYNEIVRSAEEQECIRKTVKLMRKLGISKQQIIEKIIEEYELPGELVEQLYGEATVI